MFAFKWYIQWDLKISNILYKEARIYIDNLGYILFYGELLLEIINYKTIILW